MFKQTVDKCCFESKFLRKSIAQGLRLDERNLQSSRPINVAISRGESNCVAEGTLGDPSSSCVTRVVCVVQGKVTSPFADRPTEGIFIINTALSPYAEQKGMPNNLLRRLMERAIKESDTIDMESLCIVSGEHVWTITCDLQVLDTSGGNVIECAIYVAMAALRAYRKPDVSVSSAADDRSGHIKTSITIFNSTERDPFPLAMHHTPIVSTVGIVKLDVPADKVEESISLHEIDTGGIIINQKTSSVMALLSDPTLEEENILDGSIIFSMNAHKELCSIYKPGGQSLSVDIIMKAMNLASARIHSLHKTLQITLNDVENRIQQENIDQLEQMRIFRHHNNSIISQNASKDMEIEEDVRNLATIGIDRDDPMLAWSNLHQPASLPS